MPLLQYDRPTERYDFRPPMVTRIEPPHARGGQRVAGGAIFQCPNHEGYNAGRPSATKGPYLHELSPG